MANPKRKHTRQRTSKRRAHWKIKSRNIASCPRCKEPKMPHCVCPSCGFYNNHMVVPVKKTKKKDDKQGRKSPGE